MAGPFIIGYQAASEATGFTARQLRRMVACREISHGRGAKNRIVFEAAELEATLL
jgi:hypothetical protein